MNRNFKLAVHISLAALMSLLTIASSQAADRAALATAAASITKDELKTYVDVLADDTLEGRETGSRGGRAAANYLFKAFEKLGAAPAGDGGTYFQSFNAASRNVVAIVEGSDARLKDQAIVIGAHYDHVGYGNARNSYGPTGYIHNGADDNASGVAGLLEVLDAVKTLPTPPRRSIGHLEILGSRTAPGLRRLVSEANGEGPTTILFDWKLKPDSDHWPFYEHRVPFLFFHTGLHGDYHRPSDDAHLINHDGLAAATRIIFQLAMQVADSESVPVFRDAARNESASSPASLEQPNTFQPPRFGLPFRIEPGEPAKFIVTALNPGSPAEKSGIKPGDRLLEFQGQPIDDEAELRLHLLAAHGETTFLVKRPGNETPLFFKVTPSGDPIRVGITWRLDDGEPGTVIVNQVIYGSAAHAAGLKVGDRVYSVGRRPFRTQDEFVSLLTTAASPLEMLVERDGRLHTAVLKLLEESPAAE
ncbi:MAG: M28 family peptidase [Planctomycetia bacterium]|nr:M28 family peptidase [Planctomycetia bacterium]